MATNQGGPKLRVDAGRFEENVLGAVLLVQITLGAMLVVMTVGFLYLTLNAWFDANRTVTHFFGAIPYLVGVAAALAISNLALE